MTGTDTGAGKTLVAALLVLHLRRAGIHALAMKPVCSGGRGDVRILRGVVDGELRDEEINPFYFPEPVAPLVAQRRRRKAVFCRQILRRIHELRSRCECLVIEGAGGLLSPLGEDFDAAGLIAALRCPVVVAAPNKLGVINQALLTVTTLQRIGVQRISLVLLGRRHSDISSRTNARLLAERLPVVGVVECPFLGARLRSAGALKRICKKTEKTLARVFGSGNVTAVVDGERGIRGKEIR